MGPGHLGRRARAARVITTVTLKDFDDDFLNELTDTGRLRLAVPSYINDTVPFDKLFDLGYDLLFVATRNNQVGFVQFVGKLNSLERARAASPHKDKSCIRVGYVNLGAVCVVVSIRCYQTVFAAEDWVVTLPVARL